MAHCTLDYMAYAEARYAAHLAAHAQLAESTTICENASLEHEQAKRLVDIWAKTGTLSARDSTRVAETAAELARAKKAVQVRAAACAVANAEACVAANAEDAELARLFERGAAALDELRQRDIGARLGAWLRAEEAPNTPLTLLLVDETLSADVCARYPDLATQLCAKVRYHASYLALAALDVAPSRGAADSVAERLLASAPKSKRAFKVCQHPLAGDALGAYVSRTAAANKKHLQRCAARALDLASHLCAHTLVLVLRHIYNTHQRYHPKHRFCLDIVKALVNALAHAPDLAQAAFDIVLPKLQCYDADCVHNGLAYALDVCAHTAITALAQSRYGHSQWLSASEPLLMRRYAEYVCEGQQQQQQRRQWPEELVVNAAWRTELAKVALERQAWRVFGDIRRRTHLPIELPKETLAAALDCADEYTTATIVTILISGVEYVKPAHALCAYLYAAELAMHLANVEIRKKMKHLSHELAHIAARYAAKNGMTDYVTLLKRVFFHAPTLQPNKVEMEQLVYACTTRYATLPFMRGWAVYTCLPLFVLAWTPARHCYACARVRSVLQTVLCALRVPRSAIRTARLGDAVVTYLLSHIYSAVTDITSFPRAMLQRALTAAS